MIAHNLYELIGNTPMLEAHDERFAGRLLLKIEAFNPGGSSKDRVALSMIADAEEKGILREGATIIEPTSGNTGVGLAWVGIAKGYRVVLTMPESMSIERRQLLAAYGAELVLTPAAEGMAGAVRKAEEMKQSIDGAVILGQFDNPANPLAHEQTTGEEIWRDTAGKVDMLVASVGTGGTLCGSARALKKHDEKIQIIAVEPAASPLLSGGRAGAHKIQGIGANFVPANYDASMVDKVVTIEDDEALAGMKELVKRYGLLVGISSGATYRAAAKLAMQPEMTGKTIVAILPDTGTRYLS